MAKLFFVNTILTKILILPPAWWVSSGIVKFVYLLHNWSDAAFYPYVGSHNTQQPTLTNISQL